MKPDFQLSKDEIAKSLRTFTTRRDSLLHDDLSTFDHNLTRFLEFCSSDPLVQSVLSAVEGKSTEDLEAWWAAASEREPRVVFPAVSDDEISLRYRLIQSADFNRIFHLGIAHDAEQRDGWVELFRNLIVRAFVAELSERLGNAANLATPEARALQAVPLNRIPGPRETKIFLSHKTVDKPLVYRYHHALKGIGFDPWLDDAVMAAGANLEREVLRGFEESCAAVFFITANLKDEKYIAAEVDYAIMQKRKKDKKFAIITLRYEDSAAVPGLLLPYVYRDVSNDLEGFTELTKALPLEFGLPRWKAHVV